MSSGEEFIGEILVLLGLGEGNTEKEVVVVDEPEIYFHPAKEKVRYAVSSNDEAMCVSTEEGDLFVINPQKSEAKMVELLFALLDSTDNTLNDS